ncbi:cystinosin [Cinnamomum micranthum f. kanehirae]|uniref:Cystinosin n=1 Tax=Cinnamomum micranthum f. kanehirae TaxID=337451 RepID=A0A3S3MPH0_9MAGN|nr:cystinosin [Cinnamomum micranthum f. kanehirae]
MLFVYHGYMVIMYDHTLQLVDAIKDTVYNWALMIPVAANDVAFSLHSLLMMALVAFQILIYERGSQKVSKACITITSVVWVVALVCTIIAWPSNSWLWLISVFNIIQVLMTTIKYTPQAFMNYMRKSTEGFSIFFVLLDMLGGLTNLAQMGVESIDQGTFVNFYSNIGKTMLSLIVAFFGLLFIVQHYVLYPSISMENYSKAGAENTEPLMKPSTESGQVENV